MPAPQVDLFLATGDHFVPGSTNGDARSVRLVGALAGSAPLTLHGTEDQLRQIHRSLGAAIPLTRVPLAERIRRQHPEWTQEACEQLAQDQADEYAADEVPSE